MEYTVGMVTWWHSEPANSARIEKNIVMDREA